MDYENNNTFNENIYPTSVHLNHSNSNNNEKSSMDVNKENTFSTNEEIINKNSETTLKTSNIRVIPLNLVNKHNLPTSKLINNIELPSQRTSSLTKTSIFENENTFTSNTRDIEKIKDGNELRNKNRDEEEKNNINSLTVDTKFKSSRYNEISPALSSQSSLSINTHYSNKTNSSLSSYSTVTNKLENKVNQTLTDRTDSLPIPQRVTSDKTSFRGINKISPPNLKLSKTSINPTLNSTNNFVHDSTKIIADKKLIKQSLSNMNENVYTGDSSTHHYSKVSMDYHQSDHSMNINNSLPLSNLKDVSYFNSSNDQDCFSNKYSLSPSSFNTSKAYPESTVNSDIQYISSGTDNLNLNRNKAEFSDNTNSLRFNLNDGNNNSSNYITNLPYVGKIKELSLNNDRIDNSESNTTGSHFFSQSEIDVVDKNNTNPFLSHPNKKIPNQINDDTPPSCSNDNPNKLIHKVLLNDKHNQIETNYLNSSSTIKVNSNSKFNSNLKLSSDNSPSSQISKGKVEELSVVISNNKNINSLKTSNSKNFSDIVTNNSQNQSNSISNRNNNYEKVIRSNKNNNRDRNDNTTNIFSNINNDDSNKINSIRHVKSQNSSIVSTNSYWSTNNNFNLHEFIQENHEIYTILNKYNESDYGDKNHIIENIELNSRENNEEIKGDKKYEFNYYFEDNLNDYDNLLVDDEKKLLDVNSGSNKRRFSKASSSSSSLSRLFKSINIGKSIRRSASSLSNNSVISKLSKFGNSESKNGYDMILEDHDDIDNEIMNNETLSNDENIYQKAKIIEYLKHRKITVLPSNYSKYKNNNHEIEYFPDDSLNNIPNKTSKNSLNKSKSISSPNVKVLPSSHTKINDVMKGSIQRSHFKNEESHSLNSITAEQEDETIHENEFDHILEVEPMDPLMPNQLNHNENGIAIEKDNSYYNNHSGINSKNKKAENNYNKNGNNNNSKNNDDINNSDNNDNNSYHRKDMLFDGLDQLDIDNDDHFQKITEFNSRISLGSSNNFIDLSKVPKREDDQELERLKQIKYEKKQKKIRKLYDKKESVSLIRILWIFLCRVLTFFAPDFILSFFKLHERAQPLWREKFTIFLFYILFIFGIWKLLNFGIADINFYSYKQDIVTINGNMYKINDLKPLNISIDLSKNDLSLYFPRYVLAKNIYKDENLKTIVSDISILNKYYNYRSDPNNMKTMDDKIVRCPNDYDSTICYDYNELLKIPKKGKISINK